MASSSSSRRKCHHISLADIISATDNFDEMKVLGHGGEAEVYSAEIRVDWKLKTKVAVKRLRINSKEFEMEIKTISKIQHPNLVSLFGYCDESGEKILLYEFMEKGSLSCYLKEESVISLSWQQRLRICLGAAQGLQHLHAETDEFPKGIIHRDVKPENILLDKNWVPKISDFGMFKLSHVGQVQSTMITNLKGTPGYFAPEYTKNISITRKIDVFSFGVVLFQVLCLKMPWDRGDVSYYQTDDEDLGIWAQQNVDTKIIDEICDDSLKAFIAIIGKCLIMDPIKRPEMDEVVLALEKALKYQYPDDDDEAKPFRVVRESVEKSIGFRPKAPSRINETTAEDHLTPIVIDIGGGIIKAGFAGEDLPRAVFTTIVDYLYYGWGDSGDKIYIGEHLAPFFGEDLESKFAILTESNSLKNVSILESDDYFNVLQHTLSYELHCSENMNPLLLTEPPLIYNTSESQKKEYKTNREDMIQALFEAFKVPAVYIGIQPVLSLFANGLTTGIVLESGEDVTYSVPIYEGYALQHAVTGLNFAGRGITDHLMKILNERGSFSVGDDIDYEIVKLVKERLCYIALDYEFELKTPETKEKSYTLPDGQEFITLGRESFQGPEALFNPSIIGIDEPGIQHNTYSSITKCDEEIRDELYASIVLSGGSTMLPGFRKRMVKEMKELAPSSREIKIRAVSTRKYGAWIGGSVFASLSTFQQMWITKTEYEEYGKNVVHKKCC